MQLPCVELKEELLFLDGTDFLKAVSPDASK